MTWEGGVLVDVCDNKFQVSHWLGECVKFHLQQVELTNSCECLVKVGDLRQLIHVLSNVADDLGIVDALIAQPFPDHQQFAMRRVCGITLRAAAQLLRMRTDRYLLMSWMAASASDSVWRIRSLTFDS